METPETILSFWFGTSPDDAAVVAERSGLWWSKKPDADAAIRHRFAVWVTKAAAGELDGWRESPAGRLALVLLTDQFPRNIYRDSPQAFSYDPFARTVAKEGLEAGADRVLRPIQRVFFYLPLEHSESLEDQRQAIDLYRALLEVVPASHQPAFRGFVDFARRHCEVIERFGRFPHRNRPLGRPSTAEEEAFLRQPGSSF